jgi:soluble lytic murein transglycosylase-like protein
MARARGVAPGLAAVILAMTAGQASADLVTLTSGRTLSVARVSVSGDDVTLVLPGGGEVTCPRSLIASVEPDEVPPEAPPAPAATEPAAPPVSDATTPYGDLIARLAGEHGVDPLLVRAVVEVESGFRADARSRKGAKGLMQLMPSTARQYRLTTPYEPEANLAAGIRHLRVLLERYDLPEALAAYNAGEGAVSRHGGIPPYRETRTYVRRVMARAGGPDRR